jgi:hypothetical protein
VTLARLFRAGELTPVWPGLGTAGGQGRQGPHGAALDRAPRLRIAMVAEDFDEGRAKAAAEGHRRLTAPAAACIGARRGDGLYGVQRHTAVTPCSSDASGATIHDCFWREAAILQTGTFRIPSYLVLT